MNKVFLIGRLTADPNLSFTPGNGVAVTKFTLAVDRAYQKDGQKQADFIPCVCWRKTAEHVANNLTKGRLVAVFGEINTSSYKDKDEKTVYKTEVVASEVKFLDRGKEDTTFTPVEDDDIPF